MRYQTAPRPESQASLRHVTPGVYGNTLSGVASEGCRPGGSDSRSGRPESNRLSELGRLSCNLYTTPARALDHRTRTEPSTPALDPALGLRRPKTRGPRDGIGRAEACSG